MERRVAIVGAGVSGLTCGVLFAERGCHIAIFAKETGQQTTSGAAAALWFPYDADLEPHRGQVAIVPKIDNLSCAIVCDDAPLMYAIPRSSDCVFGGTNEVSDNCDADPTATARILDECSRVLKIENPAVLAERV